MKQRIVERPWSREAHRALLDSGMHPVLARVYAARNIRARDELAQDTSHLLAPALLARCEDAAAFLADAIAAGKKLLIVADYDADGATACAVGVLALRMMGAKVDYLVPDRFKLGYGLTPELVDIAARLGPDIIVTVDNGIASVEGVERARAAGIATLITDHHLAGEQLPRADVIVNPNQPGCGFPSKSLAGVGVVFYVMLALRAELRRRGAWAKTPEPNLASLTDLVALGTVADVEPLDANNRILVAQGLRRLQAGHGRPGLQALLRVAGRAPAETGCFDLGFVLGPRLNAAGRLADMSLGVECLVTDDEARAANCAQELDRLNRERRRIEGDMLAEATAVIDRLQETADATVTLFEPGFHQGVVGILASRVREKLHRPAICFAPAANAELRGSGRSVPGFHLRDCLDRVSKLAPDLILRFGGHAQAAGLSIREGDHARFREAFEAAATAMMPPEARERIVETDGALEPAYLTLETAALLGAQIWGQGFPEPRFCDTFAVDSQRVVGERHLKLKLSKDGRRYEAMRFGSLEPLPPRVRAAYRLAVNEYNGLKSVQLTLEHTEP